MLIGDETTRFAKVVTAVEDTADGAVLRVRDATLPEIMAENSSFSFDLTPDWSTAEDLLADGRGTRTGLAVNSDGSITLSDFSLCDLYIKEDNTVDWPRSSVMQVSVKPADRNKALKAVKEMSPGRVEIKVVSGTLHMVPTVRMNYSCPSTGGIAVSGTMDVHIVFDFEIAATLTGPVNAKVEGTMLKLKKPIIIPATPPVYLDAEFKIPAGVVFAAGASGTLTYRQRSEYTVSGTFGYSSGKGFELAKTVGKAYGTTQFVNDIGAFASVEFYLEPTVTVKVYSIVGPYLNAHGYLRGEAYIPLQTDRDELFVGVTSTFGMELDYLLGTVDAASGELFDLYKSWDVIGPRSAGMANSPPVAGSQSVQVAAGNAGTIALAGTDADGDKLTFSIVSYPSRGNLMALNASTGQVTYYPKSGYTGGDAFTFSVSDGKACSLPATVDLAVVAGQPPNAVFNVGSAGLTATFDASPSFDAGAPTASLDVRWDFTNDGVWDTDWSTARTAAHTYPRSGSYVAACQVRNAAGAVAATTRIVTVIDGADNRAPVAAFNTSAAGLVVNLDASASSDPEDDAAGLPLRFRWRWTAAGTWTAWTTTPTASRAYTAAGLHEIQLEVLDADGNIGFASASVALPAATTDPVDYLISQPIANAAANLNRTSGSVVWSGQTQWGAWVENGGTYCARFVRMCFGEFVSRFPTAIEMYEHFDSLGLVNTGTNPPPAAVVFYGGYDGNIYGHTGIADGAGNCYSAMSSVNGVLLRPVIGTFREPYLGYVTAQNFKAYHSPNTGAAGDYLVIDVSAGPSASSYPVSYLTAVPAGGWTDEYKTTKIVLRRIPAGTFTMGSPTGELGRDSDETQHQVTLTKDFYIGVFEVTQKQWERVMGTWPSYFSNTTYRDARPVERVSYYEIRENASSNSAISPNWPQSSGVGASSFMGRLRDRTGLPLDLPTESQWEYACRAGTTTALNSGKNLTSTGSCPNMAEVGRYWYNGGSGYSSGGDTSVGSAKVGSYPPNAWGLYDMHGNVWEWCLDWYASAYPGTVTDPLGAASGSYRVYRGGGWYLIADYCRSAGRDGRRPGDRSSYNGFRLCSASPGQ